MLVQPGSWKVLPMASVWNQESSEVPPSPHHSLIAGIEQAFAHPGLQVNVWFIVLGLWIAVRKVNKKQTLIVVSNHFPWEDKHW